MLSRSLLVLPLLLGAGCVLTPKAYWVPESPVWFSRLGPDPWTS